MQQPPGGDPQDFWPTQELGPAGGQPGQPSGPPGPGREPARTGAGLGSSRSARVWLGPARLRLAASPVARPAAAQPPRPPSSPRRRGRAHVVGSGPGAGRGAGRRRRLAATQLAGSTSPATAGPTGQAAQLNALLSSASSPASAAAAASFGTAAASTSGTRSPVPGPGREAPGDRAPARGPEPCCGCAATGCGGSGCSAASTAQFTFETQSGYHDARLRARRDPVGQRQRRRRPGRGRHHLDLGAGRATP